MMVPLLKILVELQENKCRFYFLLGYPLPPFSFFLSSSCYFLMPNIPVLQKFRRFCQKNSPYGEYSSFVFLEKKFAYNRNVTSRKKEKETDEMSCYQRLIELRFCTPARRDHTIRNSFYLTFFLHPLGILRFIPPPNENFPANFKSCGDGCRRRLLNSSQPSKPVTTQNPVIKYFVGFSTRVIDEIIDERRWW